jgi:exoribonuclease R
MSLCASLREVATMLLILPLSSNRICVSIRSKSITPRRVLASFKVLYKSYKAFRAKGRDDENIIKTVVLRTMKQAVYTPANEGHFGLAFEDYTHFTSPIRRYPDLLVHRAIKRVLAKNTRKPSKRMVELGAELSVTERRADEATRDVEKWLPTRVLFRSCLSSKLTEAT